MAPRSDLLDHWLSHRDITRAQYDAGRRFERLYRSAGLSGLAVIDLDRPHVGGNYRPESPAFGVVSARDELKHIRSGLGGRDFALLCRVLCEGKALFEANAKPDDKRYMARRLRDALMALAVQPILSV